VKLEMPRLARYVTVIGDPLSYAGRRYFVDFDVVDTETGTYKSHRELKRFHSLKAANAYAEKKAKELKAIFCPWEESPFMGSIDG